MELVEEIFKYLAKKLNKIHCEYRGINLDFSQPFKRVNMIDLIKEKTKIDFNKITSDADAIKIAKEHNVELLAHQRTRGHIINAFFETFCEKECIQPTFVYGHPIEVSPLAKKDPKDQRNTERFELFIGGKEFANAFSELNDPIDQFERFNNQLKERDLGNTEANEMD
jgi:lysyl-tRNA synthetase class 2